MRGLTWSSALATLLVCGACGDPPSDGGRDAAPSDGSVRDAAIAPAIDAAFDAAIDVAVDASADADAGPATPDAGPPAPWPPEELTRGPADPQPSGPGWRTAQWNVCTTSMDGGRLECRARIGPEDAGRTAAQLERAAIAAYFHGDANLYSFTLQEVCERDARWIAAFVAQGGPPAAGWDRDFTDAEYAAIDERAPYAFLPYVTHEMAGERDYGCGVGISTGIAAIAKRVPGTSGLSLRGLTHATYADREETGLVAADLATPETCAFYFQAQTSYDPVDPADPSGSYRAVRDFRSRGCTSSIPDTLRGVACVRTRWQGPGDATHYRVSTCATHAVHRGASTAIVRNHQIDEAARQLFDFAGGEGQRSILSGDFNVVARRGAGLGLDEGEIGHETLLTAARHGFGKVSVGDHETSSATGTHRGNCGREIDAIYARNAWWLRSRSPNPSVCRDYPAEDPVARGPSANPFEWSDHEMMVSPLMSPTGVGPADL